MRFSLFLLFGVVGLSLIASAQVTIPGTFSSLPAQPGTNVFAPVLSTPTASLGNGLTPGVVSNETPYVVSAPQNIPLVNSLVQAPADDDTAGEMSAQADLKENPNRSTVTDARANRTPHFDFIVAGDHAGTFGGNAVADSRSLAELAAATRRSASQVGHVYTNDDISRMNQKYGSDKTTPNPTLDASSDN